jgi:hypothetical protein
VFRNCVANDGSLAAPSIFDPSPRSASYCANAAKRTPPQSTLKSYYYCRCCSKPALIGDAGHEKSIWAVVAHSALDDAAWWVGNLGIPGNDRVRAGGIPQSLQEGSQLLHPGRERLQVRSHSSGSPFSNWLPLHLREAAVDKQLCSRDEACVIGGKKHNCPGDLIGRA